MNFGFPQFLWALTALSIPLLIHLFNFRKAKTVFFSNTRFLRRLEQESKAVKKLRYWLIFALRALALSMLVFAFAQPEVDEVGGDSQTKKVYHHIYLDNSFSMKRNGAEGPLFYQAKNLAVDLIQSFSEDADVQLISNNSSSLFASNTKPQTAVELVDRLNFHSRFLGIKQMLESLRANYTEGALHKVYLISDFQNSLFNEQLGATQFEEELVLLPLSSVEGSKNIAIDSLSFEKPIFVAGMEQKIQLWLKSHGEQISNLSLELKLDDSLYSAQLVDLNEDQTPKLSLPFVVPPGKFHRAQLKIDKGEPEFDNQFFFSWQNQKPPLVYLLGEQHIEPLSDLFDSKFFEYFRSPLNQLDYAKFEAADLIVITTDQDLEKLQVNLQNHLKRGGNLCFLPGQSASAFKQNLARFQIRLSEKWQNDSSRAQEINYADPFYKDVFIEELDNPDLPYTTAYLNDFTSQSQSLISLSGNRKLLSRLAFAKGQIFYCNSKLDRNSSNILNHESFAPILVNAALFKDQGLSYYLTLGQDDAHQEIKAQGSADQSLKLITDVGELIPPQNYQKGMYRIMGEGANLDPGQYLVKNSGQEIAYLSVNIDRRESDLKQLEEDQLRAYFGPNAELINPEETSRLNKLKAGLTFKDRSLGASFIFAALLFLALEMILLWKRTT